MEQDNLLHRQHTILKHLSCLPRKMLAHTGRENVTEFVMHDLCHENCLNLTRAAFFVDNPDFDCFKGIAGFSQDEKKHSLKDIWDSPEEFSKHMRQCSFNKKVRNICCESYTKKNNLRSEILQKLAADLGFKNVCFNFWDMKHHNHGVFMYEKPDEQEDVEHVLNGISLLSYCPIF